MEEFDNIFLARWLDNKLSEDELKQFKASSDYSTYLQIIKGTDRLSAPEFNLEKTFSIIQKNRTKTFKVLKNKQQKTIWQFGIAASFILLIGLVTYFNTFNQTEFSSDYGKQLSFSLPDGSKVILNSKSTVTFNKFNWKNNRVLELDGEAFFDVETGNTFTVKTNQGNVTVLGTEFNINSDDGFFKVTCFEGKVKVTDKLNKTNHILTPSKGYQNTIENNPIALQLEKIEPEWINHQSVFKSTPVKNVFNALEKQYHLNFKYKDFDDRALFTGSFPNNNREIALKSVLKSLNLRYTIDENNIILED